MTAPHDRTTYAPRPEAHEIRVRGHLDDRWASWVEGMTLSREDDGSTTLRASLADEAALHGVLTRIRDLGLPIVSVCRVGAPASVPSTMRAIVQRRYGTPEVLELREVPTPKPAGDEVLVRVGAASVNAGDWHFLTGTPYLVRPVSGLLAPRRRVPGHDMAGEVVAVGSEVTEYQPGDEVYGETGASFAEYVATPPERIARMPAGLDFEQAATLPVAGNAALQALRDVARVEAGARVLVVGAAGGVGTFAVQIAKALGARVTAVVSTSSATLVRSIGADEVVDYTREDFARTDTRYDVTLDLVGNRSLADHRRVLATDGAYVTSVVRAALPLQALRSRLAGGPRMAFLTATQTPERLRALTALVEAGQVMPVIERRHSLPDAPEALRRQGAGHARGKSVITMR